MNQSVELRCDRCPCIHETRMTIIATAVRRSLKEVDPVVYAATSHCSYWSSLERLISAFGGPAKRLIHGIYGSLRAVDYNPMANNWLRGSP